MKLLHVLSLILLFVTAHHVNAAGNDLPVAVGADLRYRHELIDIEGKDAINRHRIRARVNLTAKVQDDVTLGFQLAAKTMLSVTYYFNQLGIENGKNYNRLQLDMNFKL